MVFNLIMKSKSLSIQSSYPKPWWMFHRLYQHNNGVGCGSFTATAQPWAPRLLAATRSQVVCSLISLSRLRVSLRRNLVPLTWGNDHISHIWNRKIIFKNTLGADMWSFPGGLFFSFQNTHGRLSEIPRTYRRKKIHYIVTLESLSNDFHNPVLFDLANDGSDFTGDILHVAIQDFKRSRLFGDGSFVFLSFFRMLIHTFAETWKTYEDISPINSIRNQKKTFLVKHVSWNWHDQTSTSTCGCRKKRLLR